MVDFRIRRRDRFSLELKFRHLLPDPGAPRDRRNERVLTRCFFFLPFTFNIRPETFSDAQFFQDIKLYIRLDTPRLSIEQVTHPKSPVSPINRLGSLCARPGAARRSEIIYELKLLGAIYKSLLRRQTKRFLRLKISDEAVRAFSDLLDRLSDGVERLGLLSAELSLCGCADSYRLVDEYLSLTIESYATSAVKSMREMEAGPSAKPLERHVRRQHAYRSERGYRTAADKKVTPVWLEEYVYRTKLLKRFCVSVLFLTIRRKNQATRVEHILYAIAAGIAMAVATGVSFLSQARIGNLSLTLFLILVGSYMVKDRLKDLMRSAFQRSLGRFFFDRRTVFYDAQHTSRLGVIKERVEFVSPRRLNPEVAKTRARGVFEQEALPFSPESILEYTTVLKVDAGVLQRIHKRVRGVADITIIDVKHLLRYLTRQRSLVGLPESTGVALTEVDRIYHLNLVVERRAGATIEREKVRLVVGSDGIHRVERVAANSVPPEPD